MLRYVSPVERMLLGLRSVLSRFNESRALGLHLGNLPEVSEPSILRCVEDVSEIVECKIHYRSPNH